MLALARFKKPLKICSSRDVRFLSFYGDVMYQLNRNFNSPPPSTGGIPWAFDTFAVQGRREFDYQSLPGGGEFEP